MDTPPKKKTGKNQPQPQEIILPDGTKVTIPVPPKKPLSPYMAFQMEKRQDLLAQEPNLPFTAIGTKLGECWQKLSPEEKKGYTIRYRGEYDEYKERRQAYDIKLSELMRKHNITEGQLKASSGQTIQQANVANVSSHAGVGSVPNANQSKSPFQLFRDKMARQFETMNIAVGDFEKIVQNMWDGFLPQEKMLYVNLAKRLYPQAQASQKRATNSSPRTSWANCPGYSVGAPLSHAVQSPSSGRDRYNPSLTPVSNKSSLTLPTSPFSVYQDEMKLQIHDLKIEMANFEQTTKAMWESFSKDEKAIYIRIYNERLAYTYQPNLRGNSHDRGKDRTSESQTGSNGYHSNKRPHSESVTPTSLDSLIICPGDHLTEDQKNSLKRIKAPSFNFEVADHFGNGIGQVLEFTWKQEPLHSYLMHHGPYEEMKIPDSSCVYRDLEPLDEEEMDLQTELPPDSPTNHDENDTQSSEKLSASSKIPVESSWTSPMSDYDGTPNQTDSDAKKDSRIKTTAVMRVNAESEIIPAKKDDKEGSRRRSNEDPADKNCESSSENVTTSNPAILNLLKKPNHSLIELSESDDSGNEMETTITESDDEGGAKNVNDDVDNVDDDYIISKDDDGITTKDDTKTHDPQSTKDLDEIPDNNNPH